MRLRIGDVIEINGREHVVCAKHWHWACGVQARIAPINRLDYCGVVITAKGTPVRQDLDAAAMAINHLAWSYYRDAKRARSERVKTIHRGSAHRWERRREAIRRVQQRSGWRSIDLPAPLPLCSTAPLSGGAK